MMIGDGLWKAVRVVREGKQDDEQCYVVTALSLSRKYISLSLVFI
jgi:hypothetical protein